MSQRDKMRQLFSRFCGDRESILSAYIDAEVKREVMRVRNARGISPRVYAERLFADGVRKGWISTN